MIEGELFTVASLEADLKSVGVERGMNLLVHSSFKSLGSWVLGGASSVILALESAIGEEGTLIMPTHSTDLSDPGGWSNPPVPESWWQTIREQMPPFQTDLTPTYKMGIIPDTFRQQFEVKRSDHPQVSFAARGPLREFMINNHSLENSLGEQSPIARLYDAEGWILLIGVNHWSNTSLHLAEYRSNYASKKTVINKAPIIRKGKKMWASFHDIELITDDFELIGAAFERETELVRRGKLAGADVMLLPQKPLIDYAVGWMEENRK